MIEDRRKHNRIKAPNVQIATYTELGPLYGKIHDIDPDGICVTLDATPEDNPIDIIVRMNKKDLQFRANIIRSQREGDQVFVAMLFDWNRTSVTSKYYLQKYLEQ
jgi:hypothetical protein